MNERWASKGITAPFNSCFVCVVKVLDLDDFADSGCIVNFGQIYIARTDRSSLECFQGGNPTDVLLKIVGMPVYRASKGTGAQFYGTGLNAQPA
jgi:hypothetical protein